MRPRSSGWSLISNRLTPARLFIATSTGTAASGTFGIIAGAGAG
jgi:hypothetical protein